LPRENNLAKKKKKLLPRDKGLANKQYFLPRKTILLRRRDISFAKR
jgi:hypothetical protein